MNLSGFFLHACLWVKSLLKQILCLATVAKAQSRRAEPQSDLGWRCCAARAHAAARPLLELREQRMPHVPRSRGRRRRARHAALQLLQQQAARVAGLSDAWPSAQPTVSQHVATHGRGRREGAHRRELTARGDDAAAPCGKRPC